MTKQSSKARLFVAIAVPLELRKELLLIQKAIRASGCCRGTYPSVGMMHATIQFLGWHDRKHIDAIISALESIKAPSFTVTFDTIDTFVKHGHPAVIYAKSTTPKLSDLAHQVSQAMASFIEPDNRTFIGHITLMRIKEMVDEQKLQAMLRSFSFTPLSWNVDSFLLMESITKNGQPIYETIAQFILEPKHTI